VNPIIIIPIYKETLSEYEEISVNRCFTILANYKKRFVAPAGLNVKNYSIYLEKAEIDFLPKHYFKNPQTYNKLLRKKSFFKRLEGYSHMLMYHTDSYVFRDELLHWCKKGYSYIGAPMYEFDGTISPKKYICTGNGGFSLNSIPDALKALSSWKIIYTIQDLNKWYYKYNWKGRIRYFLYYLRTALGFGRLARSGWNNLRINEDVFWGKYVPEALPHYSVAPFEEAYKFSMEFNCEDLLDMNVNKLPFGCHQWYKGDFLHFWSDKIEELQTTNQKVVQE